MGPSPSLEEFFGYTEPIRRLVQREEPTPQANEIPNTMPSWLPGDDYLINFRKGDPFAKIDQGYARLPGAGYAAVHPELKDVKPENYPGVSVLCHTKISRARAESCPAVSPVSVIPLSRCPVPLASLPRARWPSRWSCAGVLSVLLRFSVLLLYLLSGAAEAFVLTGSFCSLGIMLTLTDQIMSSAGLLDHWIRCRILKGLVVLPLAPIRFT